MGVVKKILRRNCWARRRRINIRRSPKTNYGVANQRLVSPMIVDLPEPEEDLSVQVILEE